MNKNWVYYGVFFAEKSREFLINKAKELVEIPENWTLYADHMTIVYNDGSEAKELVANGFEILLGNLQQLRIASIGVSDEAIAFGVADFTTQNKHSHITIAIAPGSKPVKSNNIQKWMPIDGFYITGKIDKVERR